MYPGSYGLHVYLVYRGTKYRSFWFKNTAKMPQNAKDLAVNFEFSGGYSVENTSS